MTTRIFLGKEYTSANRVSIEVFEEGIIGDILLSTHTLDIAFSYTLNSGQYMIIKEIE